MKPKEREREIERERRRERGEQEVETLWEISKPLLLRHSLPREKEMSMNKTCDDLVVVVVVVVVVFRSQFEERETP